MKVSTTPLGYPASLKFIESKKNYPAKPTADLIRYGYF